MASGLGVFTGRRDGLGDAELLPWGSRLVGLLLGEGSAEVRSGTALFLAIPSSTELFKEKWVGTGDGPPNVGSAGGGVGLASETSKDTVSGGGDRDGAETQSVVGGMTANKEGVEDIRVSWTPRLSSEGVGADKRGDSGGGEAGAADEKSCIPGVPEFSMSRAGVRLEGVELARTDVRPKGVGLGPVGSRESEGSSNQEVASVAIEVTGDAELVTCGTTWDHEVQGTSGNWGDVDGMLERGETEAVPNRRESGVSESKTELGQREEKSGLVKGEAEGRGACQEAEWDPESGLHEVEIVQDEEAISPFSLKDTAGRTCPEKRTVLTGPSGAVDKVLEATSQVPISCRDTREGSTAPVDTGSRSMREGHGMTVCRGDGMGASGTSAQTREDRDMVTVVLRDHSRVSVTEDMGDTGVERGPWDEPA